MLDIILIRKPEKPKFIQEYAYVDDDMPYEVPKIKIEKDEDPRGVQEVDLDNGNDKEIQIF